MQTSRMQWLSHIHYLIKLCFNLFFREKVGPDVAWKFFGHTQWLVNYCLLQNGLSIGNGDTIVDVSTMENIKDIISGAKNVVKELTKKAHEKKVDAEPGRTVME
jgi:DNA-directed RNA polymerase II subunit RPB1